VILKRIMIAADGQRLSVVGWLQTIARPALHLSAVVRFPSLRGISKVLILTPEDVGSSYVQLCDVFYRRSGLGKMKNHVLTWFRETGRSPREERCSQ
jgi:hypothetical protein